jgi:hypothetical protein
MADRAVRSITSRGKNDPDGRDVEHAALCARNIPRFDSSPDR